MSEPGVEISTNEDERSQVSAVSALVAVDSWTLAVRPIRVRVGDTEVDLPGPLVEVLSAAAGLLARGDTVAVVGEQSEVSPARAARLLGVSRQYVDRLVAEGVLPVRRLPGSSYRKVPVAAVLAYRAGREAKREGIRRIVNEGAAAGIAY
jgi:excisionase family DNA binding protein